MVILTARSTSLFHTSALSSLMEPPMRTKLAALVSPYKLRNTRTNTDTQDSMVQDEHAIICHGLPRWNRWKENVCSSEVLIFDEIRFVFSSNFASF